jgi:Holliday junction DNA helicase RuvA
MIRFVRGSLVSKKPTEVLIEAHGIGYQVLIPTSTFERLPAPSEQVLLHTLHYVREDAQSLFGFISEDERSIFEVMLGVSGVGPKLALAALSAMKPSDLRSTVTRGEVGLLTRIPGVGRKTAERLIVELRDRFERLDIPDHGAGESDSGSRKPALRDDALAALQALGLSRASAERNVDRALKELPDVDSVEELIRRALQGG